MNSVALIKDQIIVEVRLGLLRIRNLQRREDQMKLIQLLEESLEIQLDQLITEASDAGFTQGQNNMLEVMNG